MLNFQLCETGAWIAASAIHDEGVPFNWKIDVMETGLFSVRDSSKELLSAISPPLFDFRRYEDAVEWCNHKENAYVSSLCETSPPTEFNLGAYQQAWHMANAACNALSLDYPNTSPMDIAEAISALKRK